MRAKRVPAVGAIALALLLALFLLLSGGVSGTASGPDFAHAKCKGIFVKSIDPVSKFPKPFASQYTKKLRVQIFNYTGSIKRWWVELYSFSGDRLGRSKTKKWLTWGTKAAIKLKQPMQPNNFTVVLKGEVKGCGFGEASDTIRLRNCLNKLPVKVFNRPQGRAADYNNGGYVSVGIEPRSGWSPVRNIESTLTSFSGVTYGKADLPRGFRKLIGQQYLNHKLQRTLVPGDYTVTITGRAPQPRSCGDKSKTVALKFE